MKKLFTFRNYFVLLALALLLSNSNVYSQSYPSIEIDGDEVLVSDISKFPYWLSSGQTLNIGSNVYSISVLQYDIAPAVNGGNNLLFDSIISVKALKTVPQNKGWKIESVGLNVSLASVSGGGDNWGSQVAVTSPRLQGQGTGASPLDIAQQSATSEQILRWDGSAWSPDVAVYADATLTGNGSSTTPLGIAQQGAQATEVLTWTGTQWAPAVSSGVPTGSIIMWSGTIANIPIGWALCDGNNGTPNLLDRFILSVSSGSENPGATGGVDSIQLTVDQLPAHNHTAIINSAGEHSHTYNGQATTSSACCNVRLTNGTGSTGSTNASGEHTHTITINNTGNGLPISIMPKYFKLAYIIKL